MGGLVWYWRSLEFNSQDWDLKWDGPSWRKKLFTTDAIRFDTNDFTTNGQDHSRAGVAYYLVGRANGLGIRESFAMDIAATLAWEYLIEFKELVSLNDLVINSMSGPAVGEPLLQVGRFFRRGRPTLINRTLAAVFSPFEELTAWLDDRPWPGDDQTDAMGFSVERGHQFKAFVNGRTVNFGPGAARNDVTLGIDMEVMMQHEYGRPGRWAGWIRAAEFSRMATSFTFGQGARWVGTIFRTQTTLVGHYRQDIGPDGATGRSRYGHGLLWGGGSGFEYQTRTLAGENDRLCVVGVFGPQMDLTLYRGDLSFRFEIAGYADFAMVDSHALGSDRPADPTLPLTGVLRAQGYYYGYGATGFTRARLNLSWWTVSVEVKAHHFSSFDQYSRVDSPLDAGLKDLTDDRLFALATLGVHPWNRSLGLAAFVEGVGRRGTLGAASRSSREVSIGVEALIAY